MHDRDDSPAAAVVGAHGFLGDLAQMVAELQSDFPVRWTMLPDRRIECRLCPRLCKLNEGRGILERATGARENGRG